MLPYSMSFLSFANIFIVIYLINFIWIFGFVVGIVVFLLTLFQIIYGSFLWPFLLPQLISIHKKPIIPKVNLLIYGSWSYIIIGLGLLTIVNFFVSDYASFTKNIVDFFNDSYIIPVLFLIGAMVVANFIRIYILSRYLKKNDGEKQTETGEVDREEKEQRHQEFVKKLNELSYKNPRPLTDWLEDAKQIPEKGESIDDFIERTGWTLEKENEFREIDGLSPLKSKEEYRRLFEK
jgi:hypothetical protein